MENLVNENTCEKFYDMKFLSERLLANILQYGFEKPSEIQKKTIKLINNKYDMIIQALSGTGKTGAFTIGALSLVNPEHKYPQILIMAPSKPLTKQIYKVITDLSYDMNIKICLCIGEEQNSQVNFIDAVNSHILVGTPGRVQDILTRNIKQLDPYNIKCMIVDEADALFDHNFLENTSNIIRQMEKSCQMCFFSATYSTNSLKFLKEIINPERNVEILLDNAETNVGLIKQFKIYAEEESDKFGILMEIYKTLSISQTIIFVNTINQLITLKNKLLAKEYNVGILHSNLQMEEKNRVMEKFRVGTIQILISTDLIARGIDVQQVGIIINYDIPRNYETYIHRIGRSGRYGKHGISLSFETPNDEDFIKNFQEKYKITIETLTEVEQISEYLM